MVSLKILQVCGSWDMIFLEMNRQLASRDITQTKGGLLTKMRVMDSKPMHFVKQDTYGHSTSGTNPHLRIGCRKDIRHCMQEFLECLTSWKRSITIVGLIIFICQQNLQKHHLHMTKRFESLDQQGRVEGGYQSVSFKMKRRTHQRYLQFMEQSRHCIGWRHRSARLSGSFIL